MISIIMPAYNAAQYIEESIKSVLSQTYTDWELLIIDDCSTDRTKEIAESYTDAYSNIHYYKNKENCGAAKTRNYGVKMASGEWIAFLDSDDCWAPQKLELQIKTAREKQAQFLFTGSAFIDEKSQPLDYYLPAPASIGYRELLKQNVISCSSVMIQKTLIQKYPMKHAARLHEDFAVWLQILRDQPIYAYGIDQPLLIYRISAQSKSGNKLKAAIMTFRVYRCLNLKLLPAFYYWMCYTIRSLKKYRHLK